MNETVQNNIKDIVDQNDVVLFMKGTKAQPECGFSNGEGIYPTPAIGGVGLIKDLSNVKTLS